MNTYLGPLYHWSPVERRASIRKRGLKPRTPTLVAMHPVPVNLGHIETDDELCSHLAVCLGTSPATAWALSGVWSAERGSTWDLWEVVLDGTDEAHVRCEMGGELAEVRVLGPIPRGRIWHVGSRVVGNGSRWYHAP